MAPNHIKFVFRRDHGFPHFLYSSGIQIFIENMRTIWRHMKLEKNFSQSRGRHRICSISLCFRGFILQPLSWNFTGKGISFFLYLRWENGSAVGERRRCPFLSECIMLPAMDFTWHAFLRSSRSKQILLHAICKIQRRIFFSAYRPGCSGCGIL